MTVPFLSLMFVVLRITFNPINTYKMEIKVLGTGCASCKALFKAVEQVVAELGLRAEVAKEEDLAEIMSYNVLTLPALVVDGKVVAKGKLSASDVKSVLTSTLAAL